MKSLSENWITEKNNDKEYKQYILLAYLKEVERHFRNTKLYPYYPELKHHYKLLTEFAQNTTDLLLNFPKKPVGMDLEKFSLAYENEIENPKMINEINEIVEFSIPKIENFMEEGNQILDFIEQQVYVEPIGIVPLEKDEGYFLLGSNIKMKTELQALGLLASAPLTNELIKEAHYLFVAADQLDKKFLLLLELGKP